MNALAYDAATVNVLWRRDLMRFLRQPSRIIGAIGQPLIFWLVMGTGFSATFHLGGTSASGQGPVEYLEFFFPGVLAMVLLFASIFASVSVIEDRHQGFLQGVLAGPGSRAALVFGKALGSASVALLQAFLLLALAPLAGFSLTAIDWPILLTAMVASALALTSLGFLVAWWIDNMQAYHAVQMTVLVPLWLLSGAMFPIDRSKPVFAAMMTCNPVSYSVSAIRHGLYGGVAPTSVTLTSSPWLELAVVGAGAAVCLVAAVLMTERRR